MIILTGILITVSTAFWLVMLYLLIKYGDSWEEDS